MFLIHPRGLTWNLQINHLERNMIFQTSMIMFHVNLQEYTFLVIVGWYSVRFMPLLTLASLKQRTLEPPNLLANLPAVHAKCRLRRLDSLQKEGCYTVPASKVIGHRPSKSWKAILGLFFPKDVSSQGSSEDCWRISHHTYPTHISHHTYPTHIHHTTHIPHISHTYPFKTYPTNTYPFNTYPTSTYPCNAYPFKTFASAGFAIRIPPIRIPPIQIRSTRIPPIRIHAMRIHSKGVHQQESQTYPTNTYPTNTYLQHVSHQYGSIQCVSIQKVCISRNGNEYEYHCISFHTIATRREW